MALAERAVLALVAAAALGSALWLGLRHPLSPGAVLAGIWIGAVVAAASSRAWLFWLPALFPLLNFFPWTGWWLFDESDLLVLAIIAGGYTRWAWLRATQTGPLWAWWIRAV